MLNNTTSNKINSGQSSSISLSEKINSEKEKVIDNVGKSLNTYKGMDKINITLSGGETKDIYVGKEFLKLQDDSILKYTIPDGHGTKSNFPDWEKVENASLLVTKDKDGNYHFGYEAALQEANKQGFRLPNEDEMKSNEFKKYIANNVICFPGYRSISRYGFPFRGQGAFFYGALSRGDEAFFYGALSRGDEAFRMTFYKNDLDTSYRMNLKGYGLSVLPIKD